MRNYLLLLICSVLLAGCSDKVITGNGKIQHLSKSMGKYNSINIQGNFETHLFNSTSTTINVVADQNLLKYISVRQDGEVLSISVHPHNIRLQPSQPIKIDIPVGDTKNITLSGSGTIEGVDLHSTHSHISLHGSGDISLSGKLSVSDIENSGSGKVRVNGIENRQVIIHSLSSGTTNVTGYTKRLLITNSGSANVDARALLATEAIVTLHGSGTVQVYASKMLKATISGSGSVNYYGNPARITKSIHGSGSFNLGK